MQFQMQAMQMIGCAAVAAKSACDMHDKLETTSV
jgi:hypothetical protein